jgi:hypothetical protein
MQKIGLYDLYPEASFLDQFFHYQDRVNSTTDNSTDPDLKDFVIPDLKKVTILHNNFFYYKINYLKGLKKCNETVYLVRWNNEISRNAFKFKEVITDGGLTCVINSRSSIISQRHKLLIFA